MYNTHLKNMRSSSCTKHVVERSMRMKLLRKWRQRCIYIVVLVWCMYDGENGYVNGYEGSEVHIHTLTIFPPAQCSSKSSVVGCCCWLVGLLVINRPEIIVFSCPESCMSIIVHKSFIYSKTG